MGTRALVLVKQMLLSFWHAA